MVFACMCFVKVYPNKSYLVLVYILFCMHYSLQISGANLTSLKMKATHLNNESNLLSQQVAGLSSEIQSKLQNIFVIMITDDQCCYC